MIRLMVTFHIALSFCSYMCHDLVMTVMLAYLVDRMRIQKHCSYVARYEKN